METSTLLFTLCLIISLLVIVASLSPSPDITTDQQALVFLKAHITHDPTNFFTKNWNVNATSINSVCSWTGVACDVRSHRVISLNISGLSLRGTIPSQLGNLSSLQSLDLSHNQLSGTIPSSIFNLTTLKDVSFRENQLSGAFPSFISSNSSLQRIDFAFNGLSGELPTNICSGFPFLNFLSLSYNMFHGEIPLSITKCKNLEVLSLSYNNLSGAVPKEIENLSKLKQLFVAFNNLQGEIPQELGNLTELEMISLKNNFITGTIPSSIFKLSSLSQLQLSANSLTGEIPWEIGNLHNLEVLGISDNKLVDVVPVTLFNISALRSIQLQNNSLLGTLPSSPNVQLPNLVEIFLWGNNFSGPIPSFIFNASELNIIEIGENSFSGSIPSSLANLRNLERLSLFDNYLTSSTPELRFLSSFNSKNLQLLDLSRNPLNGFLPKSVGNLSLSLEGFFMSDCNIRGVIPEEIGNLSNLIVLELGGNKLNGSIPVTLSKLQNLQGLSLQYNKLEGSIPDHICHLPALSELYLGGNKLSAPVPACFGNLTYLRKISLASNELTSTIPSTFWNLEGILYLNFSSNFFTGPLPLEIGNLKVLISLDFSMNNLSGVIPTTIGGLKDLQNLSLGYNRLQASIPDSFGNLVSLKSLSLSNNNLSGVIPKSLVKLQDLKDLNLSFNRLEGEIPKGGPFRNFTAKSFLGNDLLCGLPGLQVPVCKNNKSSTHHAKSRKLALLLGIVLPLSVALIVVIILILRSGLFSRSQKRSVTDKPPSDDNVAPPATRRRVSYYELFRTTDGFSENYLIGRGSFGSVYKAKLEDGMDVAVKVFHLQSSRGWKSFDVECEVLKSIRHRNLVKIISSCSNEDFRALVLEYMPVGNLEQSLYSSNRTLDIWQRLDIMIDVASALEYLHFGLSSPVIHCDIKPSNVLLDDNIVAHLGDFGIAKLLSEDQSMIQTETLATIGYMAPEYGRRGQVSTKGDVYSFGIMLMETFTRKKPTDEIFTGEATLKLWVTDLLPISVMEVVDENLLSTEDENFDAKEQCVSLLVNLALQCVAESPEKRINAKEIVVGLLEIKDWLLKNVGGIPNNERGPNINEAESAEKK